MKKTKKILNKHDSVVNFTENGESTTFYIGAHHVTGIRAIHGKMKTVRGYDKNQVGTPGNIEEDFPGLYERIEKDLK